MQTKLASWRLTSAGVLSVTLLCPPVRVAGRGEVISRRLHLGEFCAHQERVAVLPACRAVESNATSAIMRDSAKLQCVLFEVVRGAWGGASAAREGAATHRPYPSGGSNLSCWTGSAACCCCSPWVVLSVGWEMWEMWGVFALLGLGGFTQQSAGVTHSIFPARSLTKQFFVAGTSIRASSGKLRTGRA